MMDGVPGAIVAMLILGLWSALVGTDGLMVLGIAVIVVSLVFAFATFRMWGPRYRVSVAQGILLGLVMVSISGIVLTYPRTADITGQTTVSFGVPTFTPTLSAPNRTCIDEDGYLCYHDGKPVEVSMEAWVRQTNTYEFGFIRVFEYLEGVVPNDAVEGLKVHVKFLGHGYTTSDVGSFVYYATVFVSCVALFAVVRWDAHRQGSRAVAERQRLAVIHEDP